ncbi:MAG: hypothetical protein V4617_08920 [Gemmatimonadota bacterium]
MHLVQLLLPVTGSSDTAARVHDALHRELTARFGGVTAYSRAPAHGVWQPEAAAPEHDDVVLVEVVAETLEAEWWRELRLRLQRELDQESILIRAIALQML